MGESAKHCFQPFGTFATCSTDEAFITGKTNLRKCKMRNHLCRRGDAEKGNAMLAKGTKRMLDKKNRYAIISPHFTERSAAW